MTLPCFLAPLCIPTSTTRHISSRCPLNMSTPLPGGVTSPAGFKAAGHTAGFKPSGLPDLAIVLSSSHQPVNAAAMYTTNLVRAAPVDLSYQHMEKSGGKIAAIVLNSGQANAGTGMEGWNDAQTTAQCVAKEIGCDVENIFLCSTGVIGRRFDIDKMKKGVNEIVKIAGEGIQKGTDAAKAIMTTDLKKKEVAFEAEVGGKKVVVGGMCKGSGMIHPDMATMLGVVTCDAKVEPTLWAAMLKRAVEKSFHSISVDGDTSTNDVVCALSSGCGGVVVDSKQGEEARVVEELLTECCVFLAKSIARDGEGATVLLQVEVSGATSDDDARKVAKTIASSSLTKAAVFGRDPNWGRIAAAAGRANVKFDVEDLDINIGDHVLMRSGQPVPFDDVGASEYMLTKSKASEAGYMTEDDTVVISVRIGDGPGTGVAWGCDLSYKYVEINADYTT